MARRFEGTKPGEELSWPPEEIAKLQEDPNPSWYGEPPLDMDLLRSLAQHGQAQSGAVRMNAAGEPVLFMGRNRKRHILYLNDHPERWEELGFAFKGPLAFRAKYFPVTKEQAEEMGIEENLQRRTMRSVDKAQLAQRYALQGLNDGEIASKLGLKSGARVSQLLALFALGKDILDLVAEGKLTDTAARSLKGLSEEAIASVVEQIRAGDKPHAVLAAIRESHRRSGQAKPRSGREVLAAIEALPYKRADLFAAYMKGDSTVSLEEIFS